MSRATTNKLYRTFVKGLITEASPLTFPEDSSIDEDNTVIFKKGNRSRRLGIDFEPGFQVSPSLVPAAQIGNYAIKEYRWDTVSDKADINFLVQQVGQYLYFYDMSRTPLSSGLKSFQIDLSTFVAPNQTDIAQGEVSFANGKGYLFVVGAKIEPFLIDYDIDNDTISTQRVYIQIRDFQGINDGLANDEEPATLSNAHKYNLKNQGWNTPTNAAGGAAVTYFNSFGGLSTYLEAGEVPISTYFTDISRYPSNNKQWWLGKDTSGVFTPALLNKFAFGNNRSPRGHYIVNAFYTDRTAMSGVPGLAVESTAERPPTVAFFSGRVWYACNSTVYFSQVLDNKGKAGFCYQEADPTSEDIPDLVATDGGVVPIPESGRIVRIMPSGGGMIIFATNGLWYISGTQAGFSAVDISTSKISPVGTESPNSVVDVNGQIFWWSKIGIQAMAQKSGMFGVIDGVFDKTNITEDTIQTFFTHEITDEAKQYVKGLYDPVTNTVQWLYKSADVTQKYFYNRILNYDVTLTAFYPWSVSNNGPYITGSFLTQSINEIVDDSTPIRESFFKYFVASPVASSFGFTFALFNNTNFADWQKFDNVGVAYNSYVETGYELLEDAMREKQALWVVPMFRRTESLYVASGEDYTVDKPSSCMFQVKWDWASSSASNKWSTKREAYRFVRLPNFSEDNLAFDTGFPVVVTKQKVRGSGRAIQFRFESARIGYDFDLLGWSVAYSGNTQP